MMIHDVTKQAGKHKKRKRLGRGISAGQGKTSGRGTKGAGSRAGWGGSIRAGREGGQMAWFRRVPKRGFSNFAFRKDYVVVNLKALAANFDSGATVNAQALHDSGLIPHSKLPLKVLAEGELTKPLTVVADAFSKTAQEKIVAAGGTATLIEHKKKPNDEPKVRA